MFVFIEIIEFKMFFFSKGVYSSRSFSVVYWSTFISLVCLHLLFVDETESPLGHRCLESFEVTKIKQQTQILKCRFDIKLDMIYSGYAWNIFLDN